MSRDEEFERCRFARAIRAEETEDLAC